MGDVLNKSDEADAEGGSGNRFDTKERDVELVKVQVSLDVTKTLRKLANTNSLRIAKALYVKSPQDFSELKEDTGLEPNILSRTIYEMRANSLLVQKDKQYYLTKYSVVLLDAINRIRVDLKSLSDSGRNLFSAQDVAGERS